MLDPYRMVIINVILLIIVGGGILTFRLLYPQKKINLFFLLIIISILPLISLLRKGTYESGDLTLHSVFLKAFYENLKEGNLIPLWVANLCAGKGCPVFEFEYLLPFYFGSLFHQIGFSFINSIKLVLAAAFIFSGIGMYFFMKEEIGKKEGFIAALFYLFAPFHLEEMHFRVGIGMVVSFVFVPFLFLSIKKLINTKKPIFVLTTSFLFLLLVLSHSTTVILIVPLLCIYSLVEIQKKKNKYKRIFLTLFSFLAGCAISCFYWLPAMREVGYTWYSKGFVINDFKPVQDYLFSPVLYGFLFQGHNGELRLIVGYAHLLIIVALGIFLAKSKKIKKKGIAIFLLISFITYFFLLLKISKPVWENTPLLKTSILPWRTLLPIAFITSFAAGVFIKNFTNNLLYIFLCSMVVLSTILNWGNRKMIPVDPYAYQNHWSLYTEYIEPGNTLLEENFKKKDGTYPQLVLNRPKAPIEIINGYGKINQIRKTIGFHQYVAKVDTETTIRENTFYFPGWKVFVNNKEVSVVYKNPMNPGLITFQLKKGLYKIDVIFTDTPIRKISKWISIISLIGMLLFLSIKSFKRAI